MKRYDSAWQENPLYSLIRDWQKKEKYFSECGKREAKIDSDCYSKTNPGTTENFHKPIFRGIMNTILEVLLKVINKHLLLLLESDFSGYYSQDGT